MRKVTFGGGISLDNFLAGPNDEVDWLIWSKEAAAIFAVYWKTIDTVVMGRRTYEVARTHQSMPYRGVHNYVFSRTPITTANGVEIVSDEAADFIRKLKVQQGKGICVIGGGLLAKSLFEADVIDEIGLNIHPLLLGSGIAAFHEMSERINLELKECKQLSKGCVMLIYRVKHRKGRSRKND